jgi:thiol-disulfide isomerase/thioredoxin
MGRGALPAAFLAVLLAAAGCGASSPVRPIGASGSMSATPTAASCLPGGSGRSGGTPAGKQRLPDLTLGCLTGSGRADLAAIRGPAVVNLWASWCGPCRSEMPALAHAAAAHKQVRFIGVDTEDERAKAVRFLHLTGVRYPQLADPDGHLLRTLGLPGLPATLAVTAKGRVAWQRQGALDGRDIAAAVAAATG